MTQTDQNFEFENLLSYLKNQRGFDFTGYKRTTLRRRINKRMQALQVEKYEDYIDYLEVHPDEFTPLFNSILINVTGFYRDTEPWQFVEGEIIPRLLDATSYDKSIRVWSAGCATGEEPFTLATLFAEVMGVDEFDRRVKIYATDVDEEALTAARHAVYSPKTIQDVPEHMVERYFHKQNDHYMFRKSIRRSVIFGRHNVIQDAPISKIDLLVCRNLLMYFNVETQGKVLSRLHFALNDSGFLFLGKAELLITHSNLFVPVDLKQRIFSKVTQGNVRNRFKSMGGGTNNEALNRIGSYLGLREKAIESSPIAQLLVRSNGIMIAANKIARTLFKINPGDVGRPFQDLEISYRPLELRNYIDEAITNHEPVVIKEVRWTPPHMEEHFFNVEVTPLYDNGSLFGAGITFTNVTEHKKLENQLEATNQELETALEEVQSTNEELETTNEELQSTVEELETTNEELQSTNEELETMNEELQATNEELETMNEELRTRTEELNQVNAFLESILTSLGEGVIVVDPQLCILLWNKRSEELWGMRVDEVQGQNLLALDIGLPVEKLKRPIRHCITTDGDDCINLELKAINRRGKDLVCKINISPLRDSDMASNGAIILIKGTQDGD
jgi:two-component system CheB/CheR fusion protein